MAQLSSPISPRLLLPLLLFAVIAVYAPHIGNGFVFDDHQQTERNPLVQGRVPWTNAFTQGVWAHTEGETGLSDKYYRPVFPLAHRLAYQAGDGAPLAFHLLNLGLHLLAVLLVVAALRRLEVSPGTAMGAAALFALNPLAGEVVYWASCTSELLVLIGLLLALLSLLAAREGSLMRRSLCLGGAAAGTLLGLLAKETAVVIAPILTLEVLRHPRHERRERLAAVIPLWLLTFGYLWLRSRIVSTDLGAPLPHGIKDVGLFGSALAWYGKLFLIPFPLSPLHDFPLDPASWQVVVGLVVLLALFAAAILLLRFRPGGLFWFGWIVLPLVVPLVPLLFTYRQVTGPIAERYMFLSLVPWCVLLVRLSGRLLARRLREGSLRVAGVSLALAACLAGGLTVYSYGDAFRNDTTYFQRASSYNPESPFVLQWLALLEMQQNRYENALPLLDRALVRNPGMASLLMNRGFVLTKLGRLPEAARDFQLLLRQNPAQPGAHLRLANVLYDLGRPDEAAYHYREELKLNPDDVGAMSDLGIYLYQHNDPKGAIELWEKALQKERLPYIRFNLGRAYRELGQRRQAEMHLRMFLQEAGDGYAAQRNLARQWLSE